jgi:hypothetical protein
LSTKLRRSDFAAATLLVFLTGALYWQTLRQGHDWGGDFSVYIMHARNIAEGRPYLESSYVVTPESAVHHPPTYPPVFPLLLAPFYAWYGLNYVVLKSVVQVCFALSLGFYYLIGRIRGGRIWESAVAAGAFGLSGLVLSLKESVISEGTYALLSGAALYAALVIYEKGWDRSRPVTAGLLLASLFLLSYGTRAAGLALLAGFWIQEALRIRRVRRFAVTVSSVFVAGTLLSAATVYDFRSYGNQFASDWAEYWRNIVYYLRAPASLWSGSPEWLRYPLAAGGLLLAGTEMIRRSLKAPSLVEWYSWVSIGMVLVYTAGRSPRYLAGFLPLFVIYMMEGARYWSRRFESLERSRFAAVLAAALVTGMVFNLSALERGPIREGVEQPTFLALCQFLKSNMTEDDVVVSWNPRVLALYTQRRSAEYPRTVSREAFARGLARVGATHLLFYKHHEEDMFWLRPFLENDAAKTRVVYENPDFRVYLLR